MTNRQRFLVLDGTDQERRVFASALSQDYEVVAVTNLVAAIRDLQCQHVDGIAVLGERVANSTSAALFLQAPAVLEYFPEGVAILDLELNVVWQNRRFEKLTQPGTKSLAADKFYEAFGKPEILGPDFAPFHTALGTREMAYTRMRLGKDTHLSLRVTPVYLGSETALPDMLVVMLRDISQNIQQQIKLKKVYEAGFQLCDLSPNEISSMSFGERIEYLKQQIITSTTDVLKFENLEIRLVDQATGRLDSLLAVGLCPDAVSRELYARPKDNGITGYVAYSAKSYLVEDTTSDPLYLTGTIGARSSLTVPLIWHDQVMGTFNVESVFPKAFSQQDVEFTEVFAQEVSLAVNTLQLLVAQNARTANDSILRVLTEISRPTDEVLNCLTLLAEQLAEQPPEVSERLRLSSRLTRDIKQLIQNIREELAPDDNLQSQSDFRKRPILRGKRILVADSEESIRTLAHQLLTPHGCLVETVGTATEAWRRVKQFEYDAVLAQIGLPDMSGFQLLKRVWDVRRSLLFFLTTGFGWDPGHSLVNARQLGLTTEVLWRPFKVPRMFDELEKGFNSQNPG